MTGSVRSESGGSRLSLVRLYKVNISMKECLNFSFRTSGYLLHFTRRNFDLCPFFLHFYFRPKTTSQPSMVGPYTYLPDYYDHLAFLGKLSTVQY